MRLPALSMLHGFLLHNGSLTGSLLPMAAGCEWSSCPDNQGPFFPEFHRYFWLHPHMSCVLQQPWIQQKVPLSEFHRFWHPLQLHAHFHKPEQYLYGDNQFLPPPFSLVYCPEAPHFLHHALCCKYSFQNSRWNRLCRSSLPGFLPYLVSSIPLLLSGILLLSHHHLSVALHNSASQYWYNCWS